MKNSVESLLGHDHESLGQLLSELEGELAKPNIVRAFELLDLFWARLAVHIRGENLHLFPAIESASLSLFTGTSGLPPREEAQTVLGRLRSDHDFFMKELALLMKATRQPRSRKGAGREEADEFGKRLAVIKETLETHNHLEEKHVYLWPTLLFDEKTVTTLGKRIRHELENLPPRFT